MNTVGNVLGAILLGLFGLALLTNGYRWFRVLLPIWAFFVGTSAITALSAGLLGQNFFSTAVACVPAVLIGLVFAALSFIWFSVVVLLWAGSVGFALAAGVLAALGVANAVVLWLAGLAGAVVFVFLAARVNLQTRLPIFLTASAGATMMLSAVLLLFGQPVEQLTWSNLWGPTSGVLAIVIWIVLTSVGMGIQSASNNRSLDVDLAQYQLQR